MSEQNLRKLSDAIKKNDSPAFRESGEFRDAFAACKGVK
jgi:hypothetical protein